ncbi:hypothetical protein FSARC_2296 [Fusarium sarcochroum]|uniref:Rhodopsin domain-containing protein n=1 Tax=Fusarium sarcochroum TaxID=1208366 RepID=A0A8H4U727_9HYPO|nr:hypothetical protein FSARC_2296 [Fusarium sarcochroum]
MKLSSWAICSLALVAGVFGASNSELFKDLPDCTSPCLEPYGNSGFDALDICNDQDLNREIDECFSHECPDFERFKIAKIHANACNVGPKEDRYNHYILLVAEVPAWICTWLRLYSSWSTYESLSPDDYAMVVCGLLYTVFATLVHFAYSVMTDTVSWNAIPQNITDGLKLVYMADIFELACTCLLRVAILLVCLRASLSNRRLITTCSIIVFTILSSVVLALLRVFRCSPIALAWAGWAEDEGGEENGGCLSQDTLAYVASAIDIFLNVVLVAMLLQLVFSRMTSVIISWLRITIAIVLGLFALGVSCFRVQLLVEFFTTLQPAWKYHDRIIWMDVEVSILVIWACLPIWQSFADSDSSRDIDGQSQLTPETEEPNAEAAKAMLKTPMTSLRHMRLFKFMARVRTRKQDESNLHLGDKTYGNVRTEIQGGQRFSMISQFTGMIGIQVKTRTIRRVDDDTWDAEKGSARDNIQANES